MVGDSELIKGVWSQLCKAFSVISVELLTGRKKRCEKRVRFALRPRLVLLSLSAAAAARDAVSETDGKIRPAELEFYWAPEFEQLARLAFKSP